MHTFAMQLLDKGVDIPTIAFFLGHKFLGSSLTDLLCTKEHLEEVIAKLER
jgi:site-specific recombinase XerD